MIDPRTGCDPDVSFDASSPITITISTQTILVALLAGPLIFILLMLVMDLLTVFE